MKYVTDMKHASQVDAYVIMSTENINEIHGKIVINWSDSGNPTAGVRFGGQYEQAKAAGGGYDKRSAAVAKAFNKMGFTDKEIRSAIAGSGMEDIEKFLESLNCKLIKVL
jgi:hypothetical protein